MTTEKSLAEILAHQMRAGEPLPVPITLAILRQVCDALDYAHNLRDPAGQPLGLVHRDLSPAHIFVTDGGLVRLVASTAAQGAYAYMAPEYATAGWFDARADLFALGVVAHEMLTNRPLFASSDDRETLDRVCALAIPLPSSFNPHVPPDIDGIVLTALARDPSYRWQHAAMIRDGLLAVVQRFGLEVTPAQNDAWVDLFAEHVEVAPAPPPNDPDLWANDTNLETRVQPFDPALLDVAPAPPAPAPPAPAPVAPAPVAPAPVQPPPVTPKSVAPAPAAPAPRAPVPRAPAPRAPAPRAPTPIPPEPVAPAPIPLEPVAPAPIAPPPIAPAPVSNAFDPELGPEPTQIGAMPLISFGEVPLVATIGESVQRAPARSAPAAPGATFLPDSDESPRRRNKLIALIVLVVAVVVVVVVVLAKR